MSTRPCTCGHDRCTFCWLWHHSPRHRKAWGGDPREATRPGHATKIGVPPPAKVAAPAPATRPPCRWLGDALPGKFVTCPTCAGTVKLRLFACAAFGRCTQGRRVDGVACCDAQCEGYEARPP